MVGWGELERKDSIGGNYDVLRSIGLPFTVLVTNK